MPTNQPQGGMADGLKKISTMIAQLMHMPDADMDFLSNLQMNIVNYTKQQGQGGGPPGGGAPGAGAPGGGLPPQLAALLGGGGGPGGPGGMPPGMSGMNPGGPSPQMPNPDELRRVLSQGQGAQ